MGVGSTGVAALDLDRRFIGVEIDESYFCAAKKRIDTVIQIKDSSQQMTASKDYNKNINDGSSMVSDALMVRQATLFELDTFFEAKEYLSIHNNNTSTSLQPIIKWPGGKEKELKYILPNAPEFDRFFEPFVGGGSVFMAIRAREYYINDFSSELIALYKNIATSNNEFFRYATMMDRSWENAVLFFKDNKILVDTYLKLRNNEINNDELKIFVHQFCKDKKEDILHIIGKEFNSYPCILIKEMETNLFRKMSRMRKLETEKHILPDSDLYDNIETAIKSALYMNYRHMYNNKFIVENNNILHCALFFFMRNYAYSGMFRYSKKGEFNVPYGGIAYNSKTLMKKLNYYLSKPLLNHFEDANIYNLDFEVFLKEVQPTENDFVFLDPPYDSEFSTYAQNAFTKADQERLAEYLINECRAKWMMIIKNTDFIYELYNKEGINIKTFDKEYQVSFMNRNDKKVTHLLITNY